MDARGIDMQPQENSSRFSGAFFVVAFIVIGSFFLMNLFVGIVIDNFYRLKQQNQGDSVLLTPAQQQWLRLQQMMCNINPTSFHEKKKSKPQGEGRLSQARLLFWELSHEQGKYANKFEIAIMAVICFNTVVMALTHFGQEQALDDFLFTANTGCYFVFLVEAVIKLVGVGYNCYLSDGWNCFDFFLVVGSTVGNLLMLITGSGAGSFVTVIRIFRVGRIIRLARGLKGLRALSNALVLTLPAIGNITSLLFLVYFIFTVLAVQLFGSISWGDGDVMNRHVNFQHFFTAFLNILRMSTGEDWCDLMYQLARDQPNCNPAPSYNPKMCGYSEDPDCIPIDGCGTWVAVPFFVLFR